MELPTFDPKFHLHLIGFLARSGLTDEGIARELKIPVELLNQWINDYPRVKTKLRSSRVADARVEESLLKLALGYVCSEDEVKQVATGPGGPPSLPAKVPDPDATAEEVSDSVSAESPPAAPKPESKGAAPKVVETKRKKRKRFPPNMRACEMWLEKRYPETWGKQKAENELPKTVIQMPSVAAGALDQIPAQPESEPTSASDVPPAAPGN